MSDSSVAYYEDPREDCSSPPPASRRRTVSLPDADDSSWPPSPAPSTTSSRSHLSGDAPSFAPRKAISDSGGDLRHYEEAEVEHRRVPEHEAATEHTVANTGMIAEQKAGGNKPKAQPKQVGLLTVLQVSDLHWFTSDRDLVGAATIANVPVASTDVTFLEHKCNGKSKGTAFVNCHSTEFMMRLLKWFQTHEFQGKKVAATVAPNINGRPPIPPPTHDKDDGGGHVLDHGHRHSSREDAPHPPHPSHPHATHSRAPLPFPPTNAHGGVNFNRVPLHHRQQVQQMQQAGFLNHTGNTAKISRSVSGLAQAYAEGGRKKRNQGQGAALPPVVYVANDPSIVWQQAPSDYSAYRKTYHA